MNGFGLLLARRRRVFAALFAAAAVGFGLTAVRPAPPPAVSVLTAARDLPGGTALRARDLRSVALPKAAIPDGALRWAEKNGQWSGATGRVLAGPMRRGEALTDARLVGAGLLDGYGPGSVGTPVRVADAGAVRLLRPGDRVDVLATAAAAAPSEELDAGAAGVRATGGRAWVVVSGVPVIAVPREPAGSGEQGGLVVLGTGRTQAAALAGAAGARLSITIVGDQEG